MQTKVIDIVYPIEEGTWGLLKAVENICSESSNAVKQKYSIIVLSDKKAGKDFVPVR